MTSQSVKIPVELELKNVQSAINSLKNALGGVSKESGFYKTTSKELDQIEKKYKELSAVASRPFNSVSSITSFENHFLKLGDRITSVGKSFEDLKFKDLDLKSIPDAEEQFNKLNQQVKEAQKALDSINTEQMKAALGNSLNPLTIALEELKKISGNNNLIDGENFERTFLKINQEAQNTTLELEKANKALTDFKTKLHGNEEQLNLFKEVEKQVQGVTSKVDLLGKIGGIASSVNMTPEDLLDRLGLNKPNMYTGAADEIQKRLNDAISRSKTKLTNTIVKDKQQENNYQAQIAELNKYLAALQLAQAEMDKLQNSSATQSQMDAARQKFENASVAFDDFIKSCLKSSPAINQAGDAIDAIGNSANSASPKFNAARNEIQRLGDASRNLDNLKSRLAYFFSFYKIMGTVRNVVREATTTIKELDSVMTQISVVTKMTQKDLWDQIDAYSTIANEYAVSIKGTYEVSQLYYQQGLQTAEVMDLTVETLKMAKIANLDYATATDYMTVAIRGFKMEMNDAQRVTDVYSALAAGTASDTEELAVAMSKTASSAEAVGSSFESTSAMIATMVSITREAPENIGSALKSIISRYGEMTTDPLKLVDAEGEEMSLNKVDKALQSVGISLQDANGQFRDFDDVILELAESWDTIDTNTQRYIATVMAGNRQQSRFLALVGNYDEYSRALELANNSEDASAQQVLKTMDSIESKLTNIKTAWQQFYTSLGLEDLFKNTLDIITQIINNINKMSKAEAIITIFNIFNALKGLVMGIFAGVSAEFSKIKNMGNEALSEFKRQQEVKIDTAQPKQELERLNKILLDIFKQKLNLDTSEAKAKLEALGFKTKDLVQSGVNIGTNLTTSAPIYTSMAQQAQGLNTSVFTAAQFNSLLSDKNATRITGEFNRVFGKDAPMAVESFKNYLTDFIKDSNLPYFSSTTLDGQVALKGFIAHLKKAGNAAEKDFAKKLEKELDEKRKNGQIITQQDKTISQKFLEHSAGFRVAASALQTAGALLTTAALTMKDSSEKNVEMSKIAAGGGTLLSGLGSAISGALLGASAGLPGMIIGAISAGLPSLISGFSQIFDGLKMSIEERIALLEEELAEAEKEATIKKGEHLDLKAALDDYYQLKESQYESAEAAKAFTDKMNEMGEKYPQLISHFDSAGNAIVDVQKAEEMLTKARYEASKAATEALETEYELRKDNLAKVQKYRNFYSNTVAGNVGSNYTATYDKNSRKYEVGLYIQNSSISPTSQAAVVETLFALAEGNADEEKYSTQGILGVYEYLNSLGLEKSLQEDIFETMGFNHNGNLNGSDVTLTALGATENYSLEDFSKSDAVVISMYETSIITALEESAKQMGKSLEELTGYTSEELSDLEITDFKEVLKQTIKIIDGEISEANEILFSSQKALTIQRFNEKFDQKILTDSQKFSDSFIEYKNLFSTLGFEMLNASRSADYIDLEEWRTKNLAEYENYFSKIENKLIEQFSSMTEEDLKAFSSFLDTPQQIKNAEELEEILKEEFEISDEEIINAITTYYEDTVASARKQAINAIKKYSYPQAKIKNLENFFNGEGAEISTQYIDSLISGFKLINNYYSNGLITQASLLDSALSSFWSAIGILGGDLQNDISPIISDIDWTSKSSIEEAIISINDYATETGQTRELENVLKALDIARDNIIINLTTEIQEYRDLIVNSIEQTSETISGLAKGFDLADAFKKITELKSVEGYEDFNFNDFFTFDETLGKYVYSIEGFNAAMKEKEIELENKKTIIEDEIERINALNLTGSLTTDTLVENSSWTEDYANLNNKERAEKIFLNYADAEETDQALLEKIVSEFDPSQEISFEKYLENYVANLGEEYTWITQEANIVALESIRMLRSSLDLESITSGTAGIAQRNTLAKIAEERYASGEIILSAEEDLLQLIDSAMAGNAAVLERLIGDFTYEEELSILEAQSSNFKNALSQAINEPGTALSEAEGLILSELGLAELRGDIWYTVDEARDFTQAIKAIINNGYFTLAEQNELLANIYTEQNKDLATRADFVSKASLNYSDLAELATVNGEELTQKYIAGLSEVIQKDSFTGEFKIINFDAYWNMLYKGLNRGTAEYLEAYSNWVEDQISESTVIQKELDSELETLAEATKGDKIGLAYLSGIISNVEELVTNYGLSYSNGVAEIVDGSNIYGLINEIIRQSEEGSVELQLAVTQLRDSLNEIFENWIDLISAGIEGSLDYAGAEQLMSQFDFLTENDFSKTQEGLKLSRIAAFQLYQELEKIDSIKARLVFDSLAESLASVNEGYEDVTSTLASIAKLNKEINKADSSVSEARLNQYKQELAMAKEILKVRMEEPDSYNFMSKSLGILEGPLNYWNNVGEAFNALNEGASSGFMDVSSYVNIIQEAASLMENVGETFKFGTMDAASLIQAGLNAIEYVDGEGAKINLEGLGLDFISGSEELKENFEKGIHELAESQIEIIDAQIQLLETVVAMEKISDVDIEGDGLDLEDLFIEGTPKLTENHKTFLQDIIKLSTVDEKVLKGLNSIKIGNNSLYKIFNEVLLNGIDGLENLDLTEEQYLALLQGFQKMVESGDYDLESLLTSVEDQFKESFLGTDLIFDIDGEIFTFTPEGEIVQIDWSKIEHFGNEEELLEIIKKGAAGKPLTAEEQFIYSISIGEVAEITDEEGNTTYTYNGSKLPATTPEEAGEQIKLLKQVNSSGEDGEFSDITVGGEKIETIFTTTLKLSNGLEVEVQSTKDGVTISYKDKTFTASTLEIAKQKLATYMINEEGKTEAEANTLLGIKVTPQLMMSAESLTQEQIQQLAEAYYSGNEEKFVELGIQFEIFPEGTTLDPETVNELAKQLGLNLIPLNVNFSFTNLTGEEAQNQFAPAFESIANSLSTISGLSLSSSTSFMDSIQGITESSVTNLAEIKKLLTELDENGYTIDLVYNITGTADGEGTYNVTIDDSNATEAITTLASSLVGLSTTASSLATEINKIEDKSTEVGQTAEAILKLTNKSSEVNQTADAIKRLESKNITASITVKITAPNPQPGSQTTSTIALSHAKGNVALAKGTGEAAAKGKTLMGELGPELVVSDGRYFTVGNNGAEFVDLPEDAIVFNHLQTQKLLGSGGSVGTGEPVTNERKAVALASGNVSGPAMASAQDILAELYELRAMWESLLDMSAKDFANLGGSGGAGGGGGGGGGTSPENIKAYLHDLERWYNLLRQIAKAEQQITYEQAKRKNLTSGYDYTKSLIKENRILTKQLNNYKQLATQQRDYYDQRRQDLLETDYSLFFTYDEDGLMQYTEGGYEKLAKLNEKNPDGTAKMNASQQLAYLQTLGFDTSVLNKNADGSTAETDEDRMANFWANFDGWTEELDSLFDSSSEYATKAEEAAASIEENLQEFLNMQLSLENKLLQAVIDREQKQIDNLTKEREMIEKASQSYIDGLNKALQKEQELYQRNENEAETSRLQRQLAILQRSGGSASEIQSLQNQIDSRLQDAYFQEQQDQIDAIQEASDNQLEKLQTQIDLMTETLEYQKENGLLWEEVYTMMETFSPEELASFIAENSFEFLAASPTDQEQKLKEIIFEAESLAQKKIEDENEANWNEFFGALDYDEEFKKKHEEGAKKKYLEALDAGKTQEEAEAEALAYLQSQESSGGDGGDGGDGGTTTTTGTGKVQTSTGERLNVRAAPNTDSAILGKLTNGSSVTLTGKNDDWYKIDWNGQEGYVWARSIQTSDKDKLPAFAKGGLVDFTGPAWVDGSKTKPEAFLSAEDTAMLKSKIFSNSDGSLKTLVAALENITKNTSTSGGNNNTSTSEQIIIQNASVNIQPGVISNDYDAKKAGELALEEMVKVARKTTNRTISR